ncbi:DUF1580 domain-containing protein [Rhodopirellula sp. JC740]|uniref:DUF1580 domain-containing protein n=1 Tax=Rhodopirellula halodulae TaxID=2894198 RepID=A0ABS8NN22_9BACT|nr:DUF1580 domain-containing protein [Rhodopirellula sp. JC740]MCC9644984.1 DUF1580 domain-containing protein [Rhodopirellula sp. JC740]
MIDLSTEDVMPLSKAAKKYPGGGKHVSQLHRYRQSDTPLECVLVGGVWMTSVEAMHRHVEKLTASRIGRQLPGSDFSATLRQQKAEQELAAAGI